MNPADLCKQHGVPIGMLASAKGLPVTLEMERKERWKGTVVNVDDAGNIELANCQHWDGFAPVREVKSTIVKGGSVIYFSLPQEDMTALFPQLKLTQRAK